MVVTAHWTIPWVATAGLTSTSKWAAPPRQQCSRRLDGPALGCALVTCADTHRCSQGGRTATLGGRSAQVRRLRTSALYYHYPLKNILGLQQPNIRGETLKRTTTTYVINNMCHITYTTTYYFIPQAPWPRAQAPCSRPQGPEPRAQGLGLRAQGSGPSAPN